MCSSRHHQQKIRRYPTLSFLVLNYKTLPMRTIFSYHHLRVLITTFVSFVLPLLPSAEHTH
ncbi:hypothetical protein BDZ89DRAFT_262606 [Hymenopellis radicata]|nr:hypothetical protein BDZ89DRAFT_262606 [Hymenopellis radicata]